MVHRTGGHRNTIVAPVAYCNVVIVSAGFIEKHIWRHLHCRESPHSDEIIQLVSKGRQALQVAPITYQLDANL